MVFSHPLVQIALVAVITGLICGVEAGNAMFSVHTVARHFGLTRLQHSGLILASFLGGACGGLAGGLLADVHGRKNALVLSTMSLLPTALVATVADSIAVIISERFIAAAIGIAATAASIA